MNAPIKIRSVALEDLPALLYLAQNIGYGVTHLPSDVDLLAEKIQTALQNKSLYFFVMEELNKHQVIGCCGIISFENNSHPFYNYKITQKLYHSESLHIDHANHFLQLVNDYQGLSEFGMLALLPEYQHHHYGKFLSRSRLLFLADNQHRVSNKIITQIRGQVDENGHSAFWDAIGKQFIDLSFLEVDHLMAKNEDRFIGELLPDVPLALELLPMKVRELIGKPHPNSAPAMALLQKEGFTFENYINIFEGGPCLELYLAQNPTIQNSKRVSVQNIQPNINSDTYMIATVDKNFSACLGELLFTENNHVIITQHTADILNIQLGDTLRISL
jgi:arginine N-succinyltransferase